jgi:hypothetical protein
MTSEDKTSKLSFANEIKEIYCKVQATEKAECSKQVTDIIEDVRARFLESVPAIANGSFPEYYVVNWYTVIRHRLTKLLNYLTIQLRQEKSWTIHMERPKHESLDEFKQQGNPDDTVSVRIGFRMVSGIGGLYKQEFEKALEAAKIQDQIVIKEQVHKLVKMSLTAFREYAAKPDLQWPLPPLCFTISAAAYRFPRITDDLMGQLLHGYGLYATLIPVVIDPIHGDMNIDRSTGQAKRTLELFLPR